MQSQKRQNDLCCFQGKTFSITIITFLGFSSRRSCRTNTQERCPLHYRGLEYKSGKSRDTWNNRQIWPWVQNEVGQRLVVFCQENILVIANTLFHQHKRRLYTWTLPDSQYRSQIDYILCSIRWRSSIQSAKTRPGGDCGSDSLSPNSDLNWRK